MSQLYTTDADSCSDCCQAGKNTIESWNFGIIDMVELSGGEKIMVQFLPDARTRPKIRSGDCQLCKNLDPCQKLKVDTLLPMSSDFVTSKTENHYP